MFECLQYEFMQRALLVALLVGPTCGLLGVFITLRGMAFFSDAVAHSAITGVAIGLLIEQLTESVFGPWPSYIQTILLLIYCLGIAGLMGFLFEKSTLRADTVIAFCFTGSVAFGVLVISKLKHYQFLEEALFGDINANSWKDILILGLLTVGCLFFIFFNLKSLTLTTLQEELALSDGLPARRLNYILVLVVAATVALTIKLLGALLVSALIVIPAATSKIMANHFRAMLVGSMICGVIASVSGVWLSYDKDWVTGPTIVLCNVFLLTLAMIYRYLKSKYLHKMIETKSETLDYQH